MANLSLWNSVVLYRDQWMEWNGWFRYALRSLQKTFFDKFRSIRSHMFFKIGVLKNVAIFTGKKLFWGLKNTSGCCFCTLCDKNNRKKNNFMAPFYGWGSTASRLEPLRWGSLLLPRSSQKLLVLCELILYLALFLKDSLYKNLATNWFY